MYTTLQLSPSKHGKQKEQEFYIARNNSTNNSIALTRFLFLLSPRLPVLLNDWSCPHKQCNLLSVYSSNPLWVEVNLTYPTDRSCVHSTDHCSWRAPQKTRPLILIGVKGANIFVITLECIGASFGTLAIFFLFPPLSAVNIFVFVWSDQWNSHWKKKNLNFILPLEFFLSLPPKPTRKFHRPEKTLVVSWERSILYIVLYYRVEDTNPLLIKARSACLWLKLLRA